jgi:hypothetical protein
MRPADMLNPLCTCTKMWKGQGPPPKCPVHSQEGPED